MAASSWTFQARTCGPKTQVSPLSMEFYDHGPLLSCQHTKDYQSSSLSTRDWKNLKISSEMETKGYKKEGFNWSNKPEQAWTGLNRRHVRHVRSSKPRIKLSIHQGSRPWQGVQSSSSASALGHLGHTLVRLCHLISFSAVWTLKCSLQSGQWNIIKRYDKRIEAKQELVPCENITCILCWTELTTIKNGLERFCNVYFAISGTKKQCLQKDTKNTWKKQTKNILEKSRFSEETCCCLAFWVLKTT